MSQTSRSASRNTVFGTIFLDHPASVNETYFGHMRFALGFACWLGVACGAALIHAVIPVLCETTASRILKRLHAQITARH